MFELILSLHLQMICMYKQHRKKDTSARLAPYKVVHMGIHVHASVILLQ